MKLYTVRASSLTATYTAGRYEATSKADAIEQARNAYRDGPTGRALGDCAAFRFYVTDDDQDTRESEN